MNDKKIIAQYLYDIAEESKSEIIEVALDSELIKIAKKMHIIVPSPDIAIVKTIYAKLDVPNRNGISLPKEAVKAGLPTIVGKQGNWSHLGKNHICGWILDAKIENDFIIIYIAIFKSVFNEEFETVKEMFKKGTLSVSFEIWNRDEKGNSVLHDLENGIKSIDPIIFHGVGILIGKDEKPACPEAYAKKLLAIFKKDTVKEAENIINSNTEADLIYASSIINDLECKHCGNCENHKEVDIVDIPKKIVEKVEEQAKVQEETKIEESKDRLCPECKQPMKEDEEICAECKKKKEEAVKEDKPAIETKPEEKNEEVKPEEAKEEPKTEEVKETPEPAQVTEPAQEQKPEEQAQVAEAPVNPKKLVKIIRYSTEISEETLAEAGSTFLRSGKEKVVRVFDDNTEEVVETDVQFVQRFTQAQLEEAVKKAKEELTTLHKAELEAKTNEVKAELEKKITEKETEIATLKTQIEQKTQEVATLTAKEEETTPPTLEVGAEEVEEKTEIQKQAAKVNEIIAAKHIKK